MTPGPEPYEYISEANWRYPVTFRSYLYPFSPEDQTELDQIARDRPLGVSFEDFERNRWRERFFGPQVDQAIDALLGPDVSADYPREPRRRAALREIRRRVRVLRTACVRYGQPQSELLLELRQIKAEQDRILSPDWIPYRGDRSIPSLWTIARYWAQRGTFAIDLDNPHCLACGYSQELDGTPAERWKQAGRFLQRAHLIDRVRDGLDGPQNIIPLCGACHRAQPSYGVEQCDEVIAWIQAGGCGWRRTP